MDKTILLIDDKPTIGQILKTYLEEDGRRNERARGIKWLDNDMVNLLSGLFSVSIAIALSFLG